MYGMARPLDDAVLPSIALQVLQVAVAVASIVTVVLVVCHCQSPVPSCLFANMTKAKVIGKAMTFPNYGEETCRFLYFFLYGFHRFFSLFVQE